ncbi:metal-dependent hydrolase [Akkermansiaceae bacterium]|nr:metal-dependent hydrolase [Akkermansiaceae bacterium]
MDSITQAALGGVVGELILGKKIGWKGMAWGLLFGTMPDLDVFFSPFMDEVAQLKWHRGISHSILLMFVAAFVFAKPLSLMHRKKGVTARRAGVFVFLVWSTHVLIDVFTTYGTQVWEPFSDARVSLNNLFIIDLFFTLPLLVCVLVTVCRLIWYVIRLIIFYRAPIGEREELPEMFTITGKGAKIALTLSCLYVLFSFTMKMKATEMIGSRMAKEIPGAELVQVAPTPLNTILWRGLAETEEGFWITYYSPFDVERPKWDYIPKHHQLAEPFQDEELFKGLEWFSRDYWVARRGADGKVVLIDMRFGELRDVESGLQVPMFQWHMSYDQEGNFTAPMLRPSTSMADNGQDGRKGSGLDIKASLGLMWDRIGGDLRAWQNTKPF